MSWVQFFIAVWQLAILVFVILLVFHSRQEGGYWMTEFFETLKDENITARERKEFAGIPNKVEGVLYTKADIVFYTEMVNQAEHQVRIRFKTRALSFFYSDEKLTTIIFDRVGSVNVGAKEQNAGKHLLGIVGREVQLARPSRP